MPANSPLEADKVIELLRAEAAERQQVRPSTEPVRVALNLPGVRDLPLVRELAGHDAARAGISQPAALPDSITHGAEAVLPPPPVVNWWRHVNAPKEQVDQLLSEAKKVTDGPRWLPRFIRRLFRKQGRYNRALIDSTALLTKTNEQLVRQVRELQEAFQAQSEWLQAAHLPEVAGSAAATERQVAALIEARRHDERWMAAVTPAAERVGTLDERISTVHADLQIVRSMLQPLIVQMQQRLNVAAEQLHRAETDAVKTEGELREMRWELMNVAEDAAALAAQLETLRHTTARISTDVGDLRDATAQQGSAIRQQEATVAHHAATIEAHSERLTQAAAAAAKQERFSANWQSALQRMDDRLTNDLIFVKSQLSRYATQLEQKPPPTRGRKQPAKRGTDARSAEEHEADLQLDAFYLAFENEFRGSRDDIQQRLRAYLPFLHAAELSGKRGAILDLGCGRGEWMELLQTSGFEQVHGIDLNSSMVEQCAARGLSVTRVDAIEHLRWLADASVEAVTSFHLIEHLPFRVLMQFLREIERVLRPGGLTILETPNPRNILVGASDFFRDMTHNHPIHPDTISFALAALGFADVRCYFLQDGPAGRVAIPHEEFQFPDLQSYVDVPRDFAVIARKT